uniref:EF-hand domain-containing protein n=1 Tax=Globisporangium ultimum (strain ATCC 200006 / CBS 805.95 / DAOM BR144) TaxID=431595 RepID=K3WWS9_GLOUD
MGAGHGTARRLFDAEIELRRETKDFARWTLEDVVQLYNRFQKSFGLSITAAQFENLILLKAPETVAIKDVFDALDANSDGRIDGLEFLAALACVCRATFDEKARFAFDIFDFNHNGSLSVTEMALLMKSVWVGMALLTDHSISHSHHAHSLSGNQHEDVRRSHDATNVMHSCLRLAESAFSRYDKDGSDTLNYDEFIEWARSNREFMLQVEQFRLISEKAIGFEEELSLPDDSDVDSDLDDESSWQSGTVDSSNTVEKSNESRRAEPLPAPWFIEPSHADIATKSTSSSTGAAAYTNKKLDMPPPVNFKLQWIYGANGPTGRNTCRYLCNGEIVYIVSKFAIVYAAELHRQRFYQGHKNRITCLDVNASGEIIATGGDNSSQCYSPEIHVWNGLTLQCLAVLQNFHVDGISQLSFPAPASAASSTMNNTNIPTGAKANLNSNLMKRKSHTEWLLASIGSDANGSMALWDWQHGKLLASGRAHPRGGKRVLAMILNEDGSEILVCGMRFILFHQLDGRFFKHKRPQQMEQKLKTVPICLTAAYYGAQHAVVGTSHGQLFQFHHHKLTKIVQAHSKQQSVNSCLLSFRSMVIFTAGRDGQVKQWDSTLSPIGNPIDLHTVLAGHLNAREHEILDSDDLRVSSLAYDAIRHKFLIGTRMGHILELFEDTVSSSVAASSSPRATQVRIIASSHNGHAISCIAMANTGVNFVSCGEMDRCIKLWSLRRRIKIQKLRLNFAPSVCVFSNSGEVVAVGGKDGSVLLLHSKTFKVIATMKNTNSVVTALRFAPQDSILAVACANGLVYLYTLNENGQKFKRYALLKPFENEQHDPTTGGAGAHSLDFSVDGAFLKSQHGSTALRFWDLRQRACERITAMTIVRDVIWQTYTSTIGWHVSGLNSRSVAIGCAHASANQNLLLTMNTSGQLALTHFPCPATQDLNQQAIWLEKAIEDAHIVASNSCGDGVTRRLCAGFALNDSIVLSSSGHDGVVCQWGVEKEIQDVQPRSACTYDRKMMGMLRNYGLEDVYFGWNADEFVPRQQPLSKNGTVQVMISENSLKNATRRTEAPDLDLSLWHVYGMNLVSSTLNQGLCCAGGGSYVYATGTLVVVEHVDHRKQQRVFQSDLAYSISCLAKHAAHPVIVVGSRKDRKMVIWNVDTQQKEAELYGQAGATTLIGATFADSGSEDIVAAIWKTKQHIHSLVFYAWKKQRVIAQADMTKLPVLFGFFGSPASDLRNACTLSFVTGGMDHVTFWQLDTACGHLHSQQGVFGRHALVQTILCGVRVRPFELTGTADGSVIIWQNGIAAYTVTPPSKITNSATANSIVTLLDLSSMQQVIGAAQNGTIFVWKYTKPGQDASRCRASSFLEHMHTVFIFDLEWKYFSSIAASLPVAEGINNSNGGPTRASSGALIQSMYLLEETNGVLAVLTDGHVVHVAPKVLNDEESSKSNGSIRVVQDQNQEQRDVALHPRDFLFATCSASGNICVWNLHTHALVRHRQLKVGTQALAWNAAGDRIAVSLSDGNVAILNSGSLDSVAEFPCGQPPVNANAMVPPKWCSKLKYSPLRSIQNSLALACRDFNIYVYACAGDGSDKCDLQHVFMGHTARIEALDFSFDGVWLQSSSSPLDAQILRWNLQAPNDVKQPCTLADDEWSSWGNTFTGPVGGLSELYGTQISALDRIKRNDTAVNADSFSKDGKPTSTWSSPLPTMVVGTENGNILLCWYPLPFGDAKMSLSKEYLGFFPADSIVRQVEFSFTNGFLVACARNASREAVILVWKTDYEEEVHQLERNPLHTTQLFSNSMVVTNSHDDEAAVDTKLYEAGPFCDVTKGDEFLAVKPWLGAIREPSNAPPAHIASSALPDEELALEFIYGFNAGATASNNVFYADDSWEIVYSAASVGIVYNTKTQHQLFNQDHQSKLISAIAVHPKGDLVATGECCTKKNPRVVFWDANSGSTITEVKTCHERGIRLLGFSPNGESFVSIGMEDDHLMSVYSLGSSDVGITNVKLLTSVKTSKQPVWNVCFNDDHEIVTCGDKHILFWQFPTAAAVTSGLPPGAMSMKKGLFASHKLCKVDAKVLAVASFIKQQVISSQADGSLCVWKDRRCVDVKVHAHSGAIPALFVDKKKQLVFSGGSDGKICTWNAQLECTKSLDIAHLAASAGLKPSLASTKIQSLHVRDGRILMSTAGGEICELIDAASSSATAGVAAAGTHRFLVHVRGHYRGELWGLDAHPSKLQFATAGDDGYLRLWDAPTRSLLASHPWKYGGLPRCVTFSSDGNHIACGSNDGKVRIVNASLDTVILEWKCALSLSKGGVQVLRYSPNGDWLAVGCHDQRIHVFDAHTYKKHGECRGHSGTVTHMDFSKDSRVLQSTAAGTGELLFWSVATLKQIPSASAVRDVVWATWSCPFGWPVQGIWAPESNESDINAVCRSHDGRVVVTGDDAGRVTLFQYPCVTAAPRRTYVGHASHVTRCAFTAADMFVLSTGGGDQRICQFKYRAAAPHS